MELCHLELELSGCNNKGVAALHSDTQDRLYFFGLPHPLDLALAPHDL